MRSGPLPGQLTLFSEELFNEAVFKQPTVMAVYRRDMKTLEQKLTTLCEYHVQHCDSVVDGFYEIPKQVVREFIGWDNSNNYPAISESFEELRKKAVEWNCLNADPNFESMTLSVIIGLMKPSESGRFFRFQVHPRIEKIIKDPASHSTVKLVAAPLLDRHDHSFALFELLSNAYENTQTWEVPLGDLRYLLAIQEDQYKQYKYFRRDVLDVSIKEINAKTELYVEFEGVKAGRSVVTLRFHISKQPWRAREDLLQKKHLLSYLERTTGFSPERLTIKLHRESLIEMGLTEKESQRALMEHPFERLQANIRAANAYISRKGNRITSQSAVYLKAIEGDWRPEPLMGKETRKEQDSKTKTKKKPLRPDDVLKQFEKECQGGRGDELRAKFEGVIKDKNPKVYEYYRHYGFSHASVADVFSKWYIEQNR